MGLTPKEYNDFVTFWGPEMQKNEYNQVYFVLDDGYDNWVATIDVKPKPESSLRVCMFYKKADKDMKLIPQSFQKFNRKGFSLVEWGGAEVVDVNSYSVLKN